MTETNSVIAFAREPLQILRAFFPNIPYLTFAVFGLTATLISAVLYLVLRSLMSNQAALQMAIGSGIALGIAATLVFAVEWCCRLANCRLEVRDDLLVVVAPTFGPLKERHFQIGLISTFTIDYKPSLSDWLNEEIYSAGPSDADALLNQAESARSVSLKVATLDGESAQFKMIDKVFDRPSLNKIVNELARRGVAISRVVSDPD